VCQRLIGAKSPVDNYLAEWARAPNQSCAILACCPLGLQLYVGDLVRWLRGIVRLCRRAIGYGTSLSELIRLFRRLCRLGSCRGVGAGCLLRSAGTTSLWDGMVIDGISRTSECLMNTVTPHINSI
jgi:hypothetical protein